MDVLVIVLCRSLTELLHRLNESVQHDYVTANELLLRHNKNESETKSVLKWENIRNRYMALMSLAEDMGRFLSPLFMICYGMNVYYIINNVSTIMHGYTYVVNLLFYIVSYFDALFAVIQMD